MRKRVILRIDELVEAGIEEFTAKGYKRTRLVDVAKRLGVSAPAIYNYVQSKEALFDLVARRAAFPTVDRVVDQFPVASPTHGATLAFISDFASQRAVLPALEQVLSSDTKSSGIGDELAAILGELFDTLAYFRRAIRLVERCAEEWPELRHVWFGGGRQQFNQALTAYCAKRQAQGQLWSGVEPAHAAKWMMETCATFAMHRHDDPQPTPMTNQAAKQLVLQSVVRAYVVP